MMMIRNHFSPGCAMPVPVQEAPGMFQGFVP